MPPEETVPSSPTAAQLQSFFEGNNPASSTPEPQPAATPATEPQQPETPPQQTEPQQPDSPPATQPKDELTARLAELERRNQELLGYMQGLAYALHQQHQPQSHQTEPETPPEPEFEIPTELPEALAKEIEELWLENPAKAAAKVAAWQQQEFLKTQWRKQQQERQQQERLQRQLQQEYYEAYQELVQTHGESLVEQLGPQIEEVMTKQYNGALLQLPPKVGLKMAFEHVMGKQAITPDKLLAQPEIKEKVKKLVHDEVIREYLSGVKQGETPPMTLGNQPGAVPPMSPPNKPKTTDEAMQLWLRSLGMQTTG